MDEDVDRLALGVQLDTRRFARDVAAMRASLEGPLGDGADRAGKRIETSLLRAVRTGKLGFDDLRQTALGALDEIASSALKGGIAALLGGNGLGSVLAGLFGGGKAGRATGGPVAPGVGYLVGERGPELFVPTASGRVETMAGGAAPGSPREVRVTINVQAGAGEAPAALQRSSRQVARAVKAALG